MKQKRPFLRIATVGILVIVVAFLYALNKQFHFFQSNSLTVQVDEHLSSRHVRIRKGFFSINRENDAEMFKGIASNGSVVYDGRRSVTPQTDYGENDFLVLYEGLYYFEFRQFITNRNNKHDYNFSFTKQHDTVYLEVNIEGVNDEHFKRPMALISEAKNNRGNEPFKKADSVVYDTKLSNPGSKETKPISVTSN